MAKKQESPENPLAVGHHVGEHIWGYDVFVDGSIQLCPGTADQMRSCMDRVAALNEMQQSMQRYVSAELERLVTMRRKWWDTLQDDLGITIESGSDWTFNSRSGIVSPPQPKAETEKKD